MSSTYFKERSCDRKKWFRTRQSAESSIRNITQRVYHCDFCDGWHIASNRLETADDFNELLRRAR